MSGIKDLEALLHSMQPALTDGEFVFCTVSGSLEQYASLRPVATFHEQEGLTLVLPEHAATDAGIRYDGVFRMITLNVHSSLEAVGLTAAVSAKLTQHGISANVIAAFYHDHIFVPTEKAELAIEALQELQDLCDPSVNRI